jgi:phosphoglycerol transferase MdoB-like AlkP superfamily enzyme
MTWISLLVQRSLPKKIRFFLRLFLLFLFYCTLFRLTFFFAFRDTHLTLTIQDLWMPFYLGFKFDTRLILLILTPPLLLSWTSLLPLKHHALYKHFWGPYLLVCFVIISLFYFVDFGHYNYLQARLNINILRLIEQPEIALQMVWQSYPILFILIPFIFICWSFSKLLKRWAINPLFAPPVIISKRSSFFQWFFFLAIWGLGIYGKFAYYPLRWSEAFYSPRPFLSHLSINPVLYFLETISFRKESYDLEKVKSYAPVIKDFLHLKTNDPHSLEFSRWIYPEKKISSTRPNVVIIILESFAAFKSSLFGNPLNPTPYFDQLAKEGLLFKRFYVPVQATARSLFATVTSQPDLSLNKTNSRNPLIVDQNSIINDLEGYKKHYFIGGSANWGNIRSIFSNNIKDIEIHEEGSYQSPRTDVWGLSDYHLFIEANKSLTKTPQPFFALIQSASYHRPYTIPNDHGQFQIEKLSISSDKLPDHGFESEEEFQSLRFQDYSLGHFFQQAKKSPHFSNTIFMIIGDHGLPVLQSQHISANERQLELENFHVPLLIYAPGIIQPGVDERFVSQLDLLPTMAGLLGVPYFNNSLGRDILDQQFDDQRQIFTYFWYMRPPTFAITDERFHYVASTEGRHELYEYTSTAPLTNVVNQYPEQGEKYKRLAHGMYHTGLYLRFHNSQSLKKKTQ